jgi:hypothetical protein
MIQALKTTGVGITGVVVTAPQGAGSFGSSLVFFFFSFSLVGLISQIQLWKR